MDQNRFLNTIINKICPTNAPWGVPKHRHTPAPLDYAASKNNRPKTEEQRNLIKEKYKTLHFASAVCTLLYLALGTRPDITWMITKLAKVCRDPGEKDYEALLWTL